MNQRFKDRIYDIIDGKIDGVQSVKEQIVSVSKNMAIAFWEYSHEWEPQLGDTKARNIYSGEEKEIDEILSEFLSNYRLS